MKRVSADLWWSVPPDGPHVFQAYNLVFLFFVPLTLYYKANGLKKLSFYKDDGNCVGEVSTPPLAVGACIALLRFAPLGGAKRCKAGLRCKAMPASYGMQGLRILQPSLRDPWNSCPSILWDGRARCQL